jgi:hypothetical protein
MRLTTRISRQHSALRLTPLAALLAGLAAVQPAAAFEIDTGNPDFKLRLDTTVRGNLGVRMEKQDPRILANPMYDRATAVRPR